MPTSVYFNTGTQREQLLYEDLIIEQLKAFGQDVYYIPRTIVDKDIIFDEDTLSQFNDAYLIEMYVENVEGYEGEKELMTKFGLDIRDEITFVISKRRWEQFIGNNTNYASTGRPNEGDLIYFPVTKKIFEIGFVDHDDPFYQISNLPTYKLRCRSFEYSSEEFDTNIAEIDAIEDEHSINALNFQIALESGTLDDGTGNVNLTGSVVLEDSEFGYGFVSYILTEDTFAQLESNDPISQNEEFDLENNNILDFSESNPFGDVK